MLKVRGSLCIDLTFDGMEGLFEGNFVYIKILETAGLQPPIYEIKLNQSNLDLYASLTTLNLKMKLQLGTSVDTLIESNLTLVDYQYDPKDKGFHLTLFAMQDVHDFTTLSDIYAIDATSDIVMSSIKHLIPLVDYEGDDTQPWIRHNNSEKDFVERVLLHSYISDDDFVSSAISMESEMIMKSTKGVYNSDPILTLINESEKRSKDSAYYSDYSIRSNSSVLSHFLSEGRDQNVVKLSKREDNNQEYKYQPTENQPPPDLKNVKYPPVLDNGNCHSNYYRAKLLNLSNYAQIGRSELVVNLENTVFLPNSYLKLLDCVKFYPKNGSTTVADDPLVGNYMLTTKETYFDQKVVRHSLGLSRNFYV